MTNSDQSRGKARSGSNMPNGDDSTTGRSQGQGQSRNRAQQQSGNKNRQASKQPGNKSRQNTEELPDTFTP
ncbi:hypothetical protein [Planobispora takensis]|nr:hypothetical protein [Planobispora takensis]